MSKSKSKKKPKKSMNLDYLIILSHLGLGLVLASWYLCFTEFHQACTDTMHAVMKMVLLGTLINISVLLLIKNGIKMRTISQVCEFALALLYIIVTFLVYRQIAS